MGVVTGIERVELLAGGETLVVERPRLKGWLELDGIQGEIAEAGGEVAKAELILRYLTTSTQWDWSDTPWFDTVSAFSQISEMCNLQKSFPFMETSSGKDSKKEPWDYTGRSFYAIAHILASTYGWSLSEIADMVVEDAFALLQEIYVDEQFQKEWQWGLSEIAYPYNPRTKKQEYKPLDRPVWMRVIPEIFIPKVRIRRDMIPVGNIINLMEMKP